MLSILIRSLSSKIVDEFCFSSRNPRLYFVSTTTSTSTMSTYSVCFVQFATGDALLTCGKKKRSIPAIDNAASDLSDSDQIVPNPVAKEEESLSELSDIADVTSSKEIDDEREGKFLNYWMTKTVTWTYTSFTATSSIASVYCTPASWTDSNCPANG